MIDFDLEQCFTVTKDNVLTEPHPFKQFFADRLITNSMIANVLKTSDVQISHWFSGRRKIPVKWLTELESIVKKVLEWEASHGRMFNSTSMIQEGIKKLPVCPYDSDGAKFGYHFDLYNECEKCSLFGECKLWAENHPEEYRQSKMENQ